MTQQIGIFGTSSMALETRDVAEALGYSVFFVAPDASNSQEWPSECEVVVESDVYLFSNARFVIGIGEGAVRQRIVQRHANTLGFTNLIHPSATFGHGQRQHIETLRGVIVCAGVRLTHNIQVGNFTIFNLNVTVSHDVVMGDYVTLSPQACVLGHVHIQPNVWVGAGAVINQGSVSAPRTIGTNTLVGSGAVVVADCEPNSVYVGVPARKVK